MWTATYEPFVVSLEDAGTRIRPVAAEAAQPMLNFPVLRPRYLPPDTRMTEALLRVEAPPTEDDPSSAVPARPTGRAPTPVPI
ncbi:MAG: hypothetical protein HPM95_00350 [Alphaproteobacteria bacterium]|nr:hypothetical protein [Alphaproteobacteria bacterium]